MSIQKKVQEEFKLEIKEYFQDVSVNWLTLTSLSSDLWSFHSL